MWRHVSKSLWLLVLSLIIVCGGYTLALWAIGQAIFPFQANGSIVNGPDGKPVGSLLIAQPFTKDEYFQPRPSAASYDGSASTSSALAPSNYALRDRVARTIGPMATYAGGTKSGQPVAPDLEAWFAQDQYQGAPHLVAQWANMHNGLAQGWVKADPKNAAYVDAWSKANPAVVAQFVKDNPGTPQPAAADLAVVFFTAFSTQHPGRFPSQVTHTGADKKPVVMVEPVKAGSDIQTIFFDMWRQDHPNVALQDVPGDLVTTSGSGLDPHITMENALFQLDRVSAKWASDTKRDPALVKKMVKAVLDQYAQAPLGGLAGEPFINVLEVNLALRKQFGPTS